ncbi:MAG: type I methionyl aminopeptidase, partial [Planctomycetaceae bacterium]|nr:type I methionyl aminopeptidase [Planctomycetaceae bacterium]
MITLKSQREIGLMRKAGQLVAEAHSVASSLIRPGVTTGEIDAAVELLFNEHGAIPLFKNFPGEVPFPAVTCTSVNEQIVHGIPGDVELQAGDILSIDTGCNLNGWCGDSAWTYPVGEVDGSSQKLMDAGIEILRTAVAELRTAKRWSEVALAMMAVAKDRGVSLVEQFVGHGIGRSMHEAPQVPNYFRPNMKFEDFEIQPGLVLAIEPMV